MEVGLSFTAADGGGFAADASGGGDAVLVDAMGVEARAIAAIARCRAASALSGGLLFPNGASLNSMFIG